MACSGPNLKFAEQEADKHSQYILNFLRDRKGIKEPGWPTMREDYAKAVDKLEDAMRELFIIEACDSW